MAGALLLVRIGLVSAQTPGLIAGVVRTQDSAAGGARVLLQENPARAATTDSAGHFVLRDVPAGAYTLVATLNGIRRGVVGVTVLGGDTATVTITLTPPSELPELIVTSTRAPPYSADSATGGTNFPVPLLDLPQDVVVVTRAVIDDRRVTDPRALTNNVAGVIALAPYTAYSLNEADFLFRGIPSSGANNTLHDGFRDFGLDMPIDMSSIARVEFLKGPESVLYGSVGSLGGLANFISKQPTADRIAELTLSADNHGDVRSTLDLSGPFPSRSAVYYRVNLAGEMLRTFRDYSSGSYAFAAAPSVEWTPGTRTTVTFTGAYTQREYRGDPFLPLYDGVFHLPMSRFYGEPLTPPDLAQGLRGHLIVTYRLSGAVQLREGLGYSSGRVSDYNYDLDGLDSLGTNVLRGYGHSDETSRDAASQTEMLATFTVGGLRNRAVAGLELSAERHTGFNTNGDSLAPIDLSDPVYGAVPSDTASLSHWWSPVNQLGAYAQDLIDLGRQVKLIVGARFDINRSELTINTPADTFVLQQTTHHVSPRLGVVFQPAHATSVFGSWANSFLPNLSCARCGDPATFPPELGRQFEVGLKQLFAHGRFGATIAAYQLSKQNIMISDPTDPDGIRVLIVGSVRSRGIELDASGSPVAGLSMVVAYAYTDSKVSQGNETFPVGTAPANLPKNRLSLWSTYTVLEGALKGAEVGAGLTAADGQFANWNDPFRLPSYAILDALLAYHTRAFGVRLNIANVTAARSYQGISDTRVSPGASRSLVISVEHSL